MWNLARICFLLDVQSAACPGCRNERVRRSRRRGLLEKSLARMLFLYPYRCEACDGRFFIFARRHITPQPRPADSVDSPQPL